jgi:hypothetical protein
MDASEDRRASNRSPHMWGSGVGGHRFGREVHLFGFGDLALALDDIGSVIAVEVGDPALALGLPQPAVGDWQWWATRPVVLGIVALATAGLVALFRTADQSRPAGSASPGIRWCSAPPETGSRLGVSRSACSASSVCPWSASTAPCPGRRRCSSWSR